MGRQARILVLGSVALALIVQRPAPGAIWPRVSLADLCRSAQVVVAGQVTRVQRTEQTVRREMSGREYELGLWRATLAVEQAIKGRVDEQQIVVEFPGPKKSDQSLIGPLIAFDHLKSGERVVLFLRPDAERTGAFVFESDYKAAVRLAKSEKVTRLLRGAVREPQAEEQVASLLAASLEDTSREMVKDALADLVNLQGKRASPPITALAGRSNDPAIRGAALTALLQIGDYSQLGEAVEFVRSAGESDRAVVNEKRLLSSRMGLVTDRALVEKYYLPLLEDRRDFVRRDAAYAIRKAQLQSAVPLLIKGLDDSDLETRYQCLMGLAETLGRLGAWAPSKELFEQDERDFIRRWQTWWENEGRFEFAESPPAQSTRPGPSPGEDGGTPAPGGGKIPTPPEKTRPFDSRQPADAGVGERKAPVTTGDPWAPGIPQPITGDANTRRQRVGSESSRTDQSPGGGPPTAGPGSWNKWVLLVVAAAAGGLLALAAGLCLRRRHPGTG